MKIELLSINKRLSKNFQLSDIKLTVDSGELLCILGPSGSGKSSILGLIGGWHFPDSGKIMFDGVDYTSTPIQKRPIRVCFQKGGYLFPHMTVFENIEYALRLKNINKKIRREKAQHLLNEFELSEFGERKITGLSGGESQRVALARTLIDPQPILLLDEIETGLDLSLKRKIKEKIISFVKDNSLTAIYVTHDYTEALATVSKLKTRLCVMNNGRIVDIGYGKDIYNKPTSEVSARLTGPVNIIEFEPILLGGKDNENGLSDLVKNKFEKVTKVAIRPENLKFIRESNDMDVIKCKIVDIEFLGSEYRVSGLVGNDILSIKTNSLTEHDISIGKNMKLYIRTEDVVPIN